MICDVVILRLVVRLGVQRFWTKAVKIGASRAGRGKSQSKGDALLQEQRRGQFSE